MNIRKMENKENINVKIFASAIISYDQLQNIVKILDLKKINM